MGIVVNMKILSYNVRGLNNVLKKKVATIESKIE